MINQGLSWINFIVLTVFAKACLAAQPLLSMVPITPLPNEIPNNNTSITVIYSVTNHTQNASLTRFTMTPMAGVEQITNTTGACNATSSPNSCLLYLIFHGDQTASTINNSPIITSSSSSTRPSANQMLQLTTAAPSTQVNNTWIKVLIEQDPAPSSTATPPNDLATYIAKIKKLAPALVQFHVRFTPHPVSSSSDPIYAQYAETVTAIRAAYPDIKLGFHPDNNSSQASCLGWGCNSGDCAVDPKDWTAAQLTCMLDASIKTMNIITALLPTGQGFDIFSIEQSYVEPTATCPLPLPPPAQPPACLQQIKACLCPQGTHTQNGTACPTVNPESCLPGITLASPSVTYGGVLGSYGGSDIYGPTGFDFNYPQQYNLGKKIIAEYDDLISGGYFPKISTSCHPEPYPNQLYVVDVDTPGAYAPEIPCSIAGQPDAVNIYTNPSASAPNVSLAANYFAFISTQYSPIQTPIDLHGAQVFLTLSGESNFLGAPGWSLANIYQFNYNLGINFLYLQKLHPDLFRYGIPTMQWAIWNFGPMLDNITL